MSRETSRYGRGMAKATSTRGGCDGSTIGPSRRRHDCRPEPGYRDHLHRGRAGGLVTPGRQGRQDTALRCARWRYRLGDDATHIGQGGRAVHRATARPFSQGASGILSAWADRRIDISEAQVAALEPDAVWAIHDRYYHTEPADWVAFMHRLQLLAEEHIGTHIRRAGAAEDAAAANAMSAAEQASG